MSLFKKAFDLKREKKSLKQFKTYVKKLSQRTISDEEIAKFDDLGILFKEALDLDEVENAVAIADEALYRSLGKRFFETQKVAALMLSEGRLIEMQTGEGKTLSFSLAAALLSTSRESITISTANDFLSERDFNETKRFFDELSIQSSVITGLSTAEERIEAYRCKVIYSTIREAAYDYLRDGSCMSKEKLFNPIKGFLLVDEADNVLIDNASHPYKISSEVDTNKDLFIAAHDFAVQSKISSENGENYISDEDEVISLSESGMTNLESFLTKHEFIESKELLYEPSNLYIISLFEMAAKAVHKLNLGVDYVIENQKIVHIDKNSGRKLFGVKLDGGLQQVIEQKHGLEVSSDTRVSDGIVTEALVASFDDFAGMSGTLILEEDELIRTYGKECTSIPRKDPLARIDNGDVMFMSATEKTRYSLERISESYKKGQPVMIVATSETEAERISAALKKMNLPHNLVLSNNPINEANSIAIAGRLHQVTVTTSSCGRGVDIILGGNLDHFIENNLIPEEKVDEARKIQALEKDKVKSAGGLLVIGFGRQKTAKLDQQLRGRAGRQGDQGETIFVLSLEDTILGESGKKLKGLLSNMDIKESDMLSHSMITKAFNKAQGTEREAILKSRKYFSSQANSLENQRKILYGIRMTVLVSDNWKKDLKEQWDIPCNADLNREDALSIFDEKYSYYKEAITNLSKNIGLQSYVNKNPLQELKKKAFSEYQFFINNISDKFCEGKV